jgi:hypothetical protein
VIRAAASALAVGLGVLKRVVEHHHAGPPEPVPAAALITVAGSSEEAAQAAYIASVAASNPISQRQLMTRFGLTRSQAAKVRQSVLTQSNGQVPARAPDLTT